MTETESHPTDTPTGSPPLFPLGRVVATPGALRLLQEQDTTATALVALHQRGIWGDLCKEDAAANETALQTGARIFSSYSVRESERIWIITEADRSATTLLLPEEY